MRLCEDVAWLRLVEINQDEKLSPVLRDFVARGICYSINGDERVFRTEEGREWLELLRKVDVLW